MSDTADVQTSPPRKRHWTGAALASWVLSLLLIGLTSLLVNADFAPMRDVVARDDRVNELMTPRELPSSGTAHPILFVDIDAATMDASDAELGSRTPRRLIADLIRTARDHQAGAIFVDIDLRDAAADDGALMQELRRPSTTPVFLSHALDGLRADDCGQRGAADNLHRPTVLRTPFDDATHGPSVVPVHVMVVKNRMGLAEGACSSYRVVTRKGAVTSTLPAAAVAAMQQVFGGRALPYAIDDSVGELIRPRWTITAKTVSIVDPSNGRPVYRRISARWLSGNDLDFGVFANALVIIGNTTGADLYATTAGTMPGSILHANIAMSLESPRPVHWPLWLSLAFDCLIALLIALAVSYRYWRPVYEGLDENEEPPIAERWKLVGKELVVVLFLSIAAALLGWFVLPWHFALIASVMGALAMALHEIMSLIESHAHDIAARRVPKSKR